MFQIHMHLERIHRKAEKQNHTLIYLLIKEIVVFTLMIVMY